MRQNKKQQKRKYDLERKKLIQQKQKRQVLLLKEMLIMLTSELEYSTKESFSPTDVYCHIGNYLQSYSNKNQLWFQRKFYSEQMDQRRIKKGSYNRPMFFTTCIDQWMTHKKRAEIDFTVTFEQEERPTLTGSTCRIKVISWWWYSDVGTKFLHLLDLCTKGFGSRFRTRIWEIFRHFSYSSVRYQGSERGGLFCKLDTHWIFPH